VQRLVPAVEAVGYLVPRTDFTGHVHSVFAQACNVACDGALLTLSASRAGDGPATLRLARGAPPDLRAVFDAGEPVHCRRGRAKTRRVELRLAEALVWRPAAPRPLLPGPRLDAHLRFAVARLAQRRRSCSSVIDGDAAPLVAALMSACRDLDRERAARHADRLIGWGEGLTPAGDDFLVGLAAALAGLAGDNLERRSFRDGLATTLGACEGRTTPIAAHYLRLAAQGHYNDPLLALRDALLGEDRRELVGMALERAFDCGATSGADTVSGLLAGLAAWPAPAAGTA
jgi:hypothetical protein